MQPLSCQEPWRRSWETGETGGEDRQVPGAELWAVDASVSAPACVSCPQRAEALECTAPVCCSAAPLDSPSPRGLPTGPDEAQHREAAPHDSGAQLLFLFKN